MSDDPPPADTPQDSSPVDLTEIDAIYGIGVEVRVVLGRSVMPVSQLLKLGRGAVVELDTAIGQPVSLYVNNLLVAQGEVVIIDEIRIGVSITRVVFTNRAPNSG